MRKTTHARAGYFFLYLYLLIMVIGMVGCSSQKEESSALQEIPVSDEEETFSEEETEILPEESIYVHVCGEVNAPGVYELPTGSRVCAAIEAAGGITEKASEASLNQAEKLSDGQQVYVPSGEETEGRVLYGQGVNEADDGKVNLNTAAKEELMTLDGIGEVKAEAIIRYREENGGFSSIEELKEIEGIKDGVFNKVKDQVKT